MAYICFSHPKTTFFQIVPKLVGYRTKDLIPPPPPTPGRNNPVSGSSSSEAAYAFHEQTSVLRCRLARPVAATLLFYPGLGLAWYWLSPLPWQKNTAVYFLFMGDLFSPFAVLISFLTLLARSLYCPTTCTSPLLILITTCPLPHCT